MNTIFKVFLKFLLIIILIPVSLFFIFPIGHFIFDRGEQTNKESLKTLKGEVVYKSGSSKFYKILASGEERVPISDSEYEKYNKDFRNQFLYPGAGEDLCNFQGREVLNLKEISQEGMGKGLVVEKGNLYFVNEYGESRLLYEYPRGKWHDFWYDPIGFGNGGPSEASWSPDRNYIIFMLNEGGSNEIMIVNKDGTQLAKLANGRNPIWKDSFDTPYPVSQTRYLVDPLNATTSFFGIDYGPLYVICGTAALSVGNSFVINIDGGVNFIPIDVQSDRTWSMRAFHSSNPVILYSKDRNPSTFKLDTILLKGSLNNRGQYVP